MALPGPLTVTSQGARRLAARAATDAHGVGGQVPETPRIPLISGAPKRHPPQNLHRGVAKTMCFFNNLLFFFFGIFLCPPRGREWAQNVSPEASFRTPKYRPNPANGDPIGGENTF